MYAVIGIILIGFTIALGVYYDRKQFMRRNAAGVEEFQSYGHKAKARVEEGAAKAVGVISALTGLGFIIAQFK